MIDSTDYGDRPVVYFNGKSCRRGHHISSRRLNTFDAHPLIHSLFQSSLMYISPKAYLTPNEYLWLETKSSIKHEYINGRVYAMTDDNDAHVAITLNLAVLLADHLSTSDDKLHLADTNVYIESQNCFYYPDVMATSHQPSNLSKSSHPIDSAPKVIIEVLSTASEALDRGEKFAGYQTLNSLEEYVLISTHHQRVECFRRSKTGLWTLQYYTSKLDWFYLQSIDLTSTLTALYENVKLEEVDSYR